MPLKTAPAKTNPFDAPKLRTVGDAPTKKDLVDALVIIRLKEYKPDMQSKFGATEAAFIEELYVCEGEHAGRYTDAAYFGLMGRQIGEALDAGQIAPARVVTGVTKAGSEWVGVNFDLDEDDLAAAAEYYQSNQPAPF